MDGQNGRFKSWEHCYKFFSEPTLDRRTASLHLGFYLASWGMYRGSAPIFRKDFTIHNDAVCLLMSDKYGSLKDLKIESVTQDNFNLICDLIDKISEIYTRQLVDLKPNDNKINRHNFKEDKSKVPSETLITKILMGTLACTPAFDTYFNYALKVLPQTTGTLSFPNEHSNRSIKKKLALVFGWAKNFDWSCEKLGEISFYPNVKCLDMYLWKYGLESWNRDHSAK